MKIHGPPQLNRLDPLQRAEGERQAASAAHGDSGDNTVVLSDTASFISALRETASGLSVVRMSEVARSREDIASGAIDSDAEIASASDGILATIG